MNIHEILRQTTGSMHEIEAFFALIEIAAKMKTGAPQETELSFANRLNQSDALHFLEGGAKILLEADIDTRFRSISKYLDHFPSPTIGEFWIRNDACDQIINLIDKTQTVRFSYAAAFRPCITHALRSVQLGYTPRITYCSRSESDRDRMGNLAALLELDHVITFETSQSWNRTTNENAPLEVMFPPFGSNVRDESSVPLNVLNSIGVEAGKSGRLSYESITIADAVERIDGRAIICVSDGALFRMVGTETTTRRNLMDSGRLHSVLSIPSGLMFTNTSIKTNLIVISPKSELQREVLFVDLGHDILSQKGKRGRSEVLEDVNWNSIIHSENSKPLPHMRVVTFDEIHENNFVLLPERYLNIGAKERLDEFLMTSDVASLEEIVEMIRPTSITPDDDGEYTLLEASPSDTNSRGFIGKPGRAITVDRAKYNRAFNQQLRPEDILISIKGNVGVVAMVPPQVPRGEAPEIWTAGQSMMILRPKKRGSISTLALYEYLSNSTVQEFMKSLSGGSVIQNLAMKDLKNFPVAIPDAVAVEKAETNFAERQAIFDQMEELRIKLEDVRSRSWPHELLKPAPD